MMLPSFWLLMKAQSQNLLRAIKMAMPFDPECLFLGIISGKASQGGEVTCRKMLAEAASGNGELGGGGASTKGIRRSDKKWCLLNHKEGNGTPLQYSCLENLIDRGAWWAAVHGIAQSRTQLSDFTFTFHFHALEKEMATHSSVLAWRILGTGKPGGLLSMGLHRVRHD